MRATTPRGRVFPTCAGRTWVWRTWLLLLAVHGLLIGEGMGASWEKLNLCDEVSFCRRHRGRAPISPGAVVDGSSVSIAADGRSLTGRMSSAGRTEYSLQFQVLVLPVASSRVFRLIVTDAEGYGDGPRYSVPDVLEEGLQPLRINASNVDTATDPNKVVVRSSSDASEPAEPCVPHPCLEIQYSPFRVALVSASVSGAAHESITLNDRALFHFEQHKFMRELKVRDEERQTRHREQLRRREDAEAAKRKAATEAQRAASSSAPDHVAVDEEDERDGDQDDYEDYYGDEDLEEDLDAVEESPDEAVPAETAGREEEEPPSYDATLEASLCDGCWEEKVKGGFRDTRARGPESYGVDVGFPSKRFLYGLPERTLSFALPNTVPADGREDGAHAAGEPIRFYNLDVFEFELERAFGLYGAVPLLLARGEDATTVGVLWLNAAETYVDIASDVRDGGRDGRSTHWISESGAMDVLFLAGPTAADVFEQNVGLTGRPAMVNGFSLGYHQCRWNYRDDADARYVDAMFDLYNIPYDTLWLDIEHTDGKRYFTWDYTKFADPEQLQLDVAERGRKMVTIIDPHVKVAKDYKLHEYALNHQLYVKKEDGRTDYDGWCWPGKSSYLDFTSERVRSHWRDMFHGDEYPHFTDHLFTWNDMNEPSVFNGPEMTMPKSLKHEGGWEHRDLHNLYGYYVHRATFEGLFDAREGDIRPFVLSRSFFSGSQRWGAVWTGDNSATWAHMRSSVPMLLSLSVTGITFCGADVGGFFGNPSEELLTRWYQLGAWQPFFRGHAHLDTNRREPWVFSANTTRRIREAVIARYQYLPLWYTLFASAALGESLPFDPQLTGPPMRPVWWHFDGFEAEEEHFLVGNSLLVASVLHEDATDVPVRLPGAPAVWYDVYGSAGTPFLESTLRVDMDRMVVFQRGGSIVAKKERLRRSSRAMRGDPYTLAIALDAQGTASGEVYLDDTYSYAYRNSDSFALCGFEFDGEVLHGRVKAGGTSAFDGSDVPIERLVFYGVGHAPEAVTLRGGGAADQELPFSYHDGALEVKKPGVKMVSAWSIHLRF